MPGLDSLGVETTPTSTRVGAPVESLVTPTGALAIPDKQVIASSGVVSEAPSPRVKAVKKKKVWKFKTVNLPRDDFAVLTELAKAKGMRATQLVRLWIKENTPTTPTPA